MQDGLQQALKALHSLCEGSGLLLCVYVCGWLVKLGLSYGVLCCSTKQEIQYVFLT